MSISKSTETSQGGRPTKWYRLPSNAELAEKLGLEVSRIADELDLQDLSSAKQTRMSAYRKYIERRPGQYPTQWLSKRLGVSKVTKNRYDKTIRDLHKRPEYSAKRLYWNTLNEIPDETVPGMFLEDDTGKRYPAKRGIAGKLMKDKRTIRLCKQLPNMYWIGSRFESPQPLAVSENRVGQKVQQTAYAEMWQRAQDAYGEPVIWVAQNTPKTAEKHVSQSSTNQHSQAPQNESKSAHLDIGYAHLNPNRRFKLEYLEQHALTFQEQIQSLSKERISLVAVRRLICRYGVTAIRKAISYTRQRDDIDNPPGFITTILRSQQVVQRLKSGPPPFCCF